MAKKVKDIKSSKENKKPEEKVEVKTVEEVSTDEVIDFSNIAEARKHFKPMSQDAMVNYAMLIDRNYLHLSEEEKSSNHHLAQMAIHMQPIFNATMVAIPIREVVLGNGIYTRILDKVAYPQLQNLASSIGYELPSPEELGKLSAKALENAGVKKEGEQLEITFSKEKVDKEVAEQIKKDDAASKEKVDLGVKAPKSDEELSKVLQYLVNQKNDLTPINTLMNAINWLKSYRYTQAAIAKNDDEKAALDALTMCDWIKQITDYCHPNILFLAIGQTWKKYILDSKDPLFAFLCARINFAKKLTIQSTCDVVNSIVRWVVKYNMDAAKKYINDPKLKEEFKSKYHDSIVECENVLDYMSNCDIDAAVAGVDPKGEGIHRACYHMIVNAFYPSKTRDGAFREVNNTRFLNLDHNVKQIAGIIINGFRDTVNVSSNYGEEFIENLIPVPTEKKEEGKKEEEADSKSNSESSNSKTEATKEEAKSSPKSDKGNKKEPKKA